jgi:transcriptional regulator with XRE-family HTH domain
MKFPLPHPAARAISAFGHDLSLARRRRRITQSSMAERMGVGLATLKRLEKGDPRVAFETVARALHVLGEIERLNKLLDTRDDALGLALMDAQVPMRVRTRKTAAGL